MKSRFFAFLVALTLSAPVFAGAYEDMEEAMSRGDTRAVVALIERGMEVNTVDRQGNTLLIQSIRRDLPEMFDYLMQRKARVNLRNRNGETALSIAAYLGRAQYAQRLVEAGAEVNFFGWPPLVYAAYNGHTEIVDYLIEHGAEVDAKAENGSTALFFAARLGHIETVEALLAHQADPSIVNDSGETALDWALKGNNTRIADLLRAEGREQKNLIPETSGQSHEPTPGA
jgi:ankyrin repeat protein